jgi:proteasome beta subunit
MVPMFSSDASVVSASHGPTGLPDHVRHGTTTIGLVCKDGVVLATERRATMGGGFIANKVAQKLFKVDDGIGMTIAGWVGDAQSLVRYLRAELRLYRLRRSAPISVEGAATMLANILNGNRMMPYLAWLLVGGYDKKGAHLFSVDPAGGSIEDTFVSVGSGSSVAYGLLEEAYREGLSTSEGVDLALRALTVAMKRDSNSGDGYLVAIINEKGYQDVPDSDIKKRLTKLKLD